MRARAVSFARAAARRSHAATWRRVAHLHPLWRAPATAPAAPRRPRAGVASREYKARARSLLPSRPSLVRLSSSAVRVTLAGTQQGLSSSTCSAARAEDLPRVQSWQRCACAASETPSLATVVTAVPGQEDFAPYMDRVEDVLETQCDIVDPLRCFEGETLAEDELVDFVVVGAGSAGSVVAGRLSEHPEFTVALLEAGGPEPTGTQIPGTYFSYLKSDIDWNYPLEPQTNAFLGQPGGLGYWPRGKVMGGTGVLHGMMYMRGNKWDYDNWAALGNEGWSYDEVLPYFKKSEDNRQIGTYAEAEYHGTGGPVTIEQFHDYPILADYILAGAKELGYRALVDLVGHNQTGFTLAQSTTRDGARLSLSKAFLHTAVYRSNLKISQHSLATKILIDETTKRAKGVQYERDGVLHNVYARKEVIVSAGAVASPQLLLLSGIGPKADLEALGIKVLADLPVGENLLNHVSFTLKFRILSGEAHEQLSNTTVFEFISNRTGPLTSTGLSQLTGFIRSSIPGGDAPADVPDTQIFFAGFLANASRTGADDEQPITGPVPYFEITPTLLRPSSAGTLKLRSTDPHDLPLIHANYFEVVHDTTPTAGCEHIEYNTDAYWACSVKYLTNPENHQGINGLRVMDASVMPRVPGGNVNGPIIMVAEKGVDMVIQDNSASTSS
ncbi:Glucose dehydrogenase [FAD, quinone] [Gryllus bimaculatus]|nr:Glucose dehydrogenase [FAD, quinone] [Gryllus bimaculatus]